MGKYVRVHPVFSARSELEKERVLVGYIVTAGWDWRVFFNAKWMLDLAFELEGYSSQGIVSQDVASQIGRRVKDIVCALEKVSNHYDLFDKPGYTLVPLIRRYFEDGCTFPERSCV
jgi:hypothetical protein